ncbi:MAG: protein kinase domain-containing protein [Acidobacteriota bacterium]
MESGTRLGTYEIVALIGAGGMGEVYRARDSRLGRETAIKVLPDIFSKDPERLARFEREARLLASLNHANIGHIYGLEESNGTRFLVLELVPGLTLAERIAAGPLEIPEALDMCRQIADALEAAHEKGIIHRDLKPANVKVTDEGKIKVLDFGLAKALVTAESSPGISLSPTVTSRSLGEGIILGTAAYMSPEQARGKPLDKRTDIWSFGCVLYEMLTGRQAFSGETVTDIIAAIVHKDPDWSALPGATPSRVRALLQPCLQKDRNRRLRDIGDARIDIDSALAGQSAVSPTAPALSARRSAQYLPWMLAGLFFLGMLAAGFLDLHAPADKPQAVRFTITLPQNATFAGTLANSIVLSPDGRQLVISGFIAGRRAMLVRPLDSFSEQVLPGAEEGLFPFWSTDSRSIGFFAFRQLKKIDPSGGPAVTLCNAVGGLGGAWNDKGVIVFGSGDGLYRIPEAGGTPVALTKVDPSRQESSHRWPWFLPDGVHFLYSAQSSQPEHQGVYVGSLDSKETTRLLPTDSMAIYSPAGYLLFVRDRTLMAQPFDAAGLRLTGEALPIVQEITRVPNLGLAHVSASRNGILAYATGNTRPDFQLGWYDRRGVKLEQIGEPASYRAPALSPDGNRIAVEIIDRTGSFGDIWLFEKRRGTLARFTFDPASDQAPVWSPDGSRILFVSTRNRVSTLFQKIASGAGNEELVYKSDGQLIPTDWSPDDRFILFEAQDPKTRSDLWVLPLFGDRKAYPLLQGEFEERRGRFSPDGKWIAYTSNESAISEVYVQPFPPTGGKWLISTKGGDQPAWRHDGKELFYLAPDKKMISVSINASSSSFEAGVPKALFEANLSLVGGYRNFYAPSADGQRFLIYTPMPQSGPAAVNVVLNWAADLKR